MVILIVLFSADVQFCCDVSFCSSAARTCTHFHRCALPSRTLPALFRRALHTAAHAFTHTGLRTHDTPTPTAPTPHPTRARTPRRTTRAVAASARGRKNHGGRIPIGGDTLVTLLCPCLCQCPPCHPAYRKPALHTTLPTSLSCLSADQVFEQPGLFACGFNAGRRRRGRAGTQRGLTWRALAYRGQRHFWADGTRLRGDGVDGG